MQPDQLERGRDAFRQQAWGDAFAALATVDQTDPLGPKDLERLAVAAYLLGRDADSEESWTRAHSRQLEEGDRAGAARCAFWIGLRLVLRGEMARGGGWLGRAMRVLEEHHQDCVEVGYLRLPHAMQSMGGGDYDTALAGFGEAAESARRFGDRDLQAMAMLGEGQTRIRMGETSAGVALLDEAMVAVEAHEVSPIPSGIIYCAVIEECHAVFDLRRAREWTAALSRWCAAQPDLVPYQGQCLVHRAQIMQLGGAWPDALVEARRACERLADPPGQPAIGMALCQLAELQRLRGEFGEAEAAYREAVRWGCSPQPGLALLRLAQGQVDAAQTAIRAAVEEAGGLLARTKVLPACVEIMLAAGAVDTARAAADEMNTVAEHHDFTFLRAVAAQTSGSVLLAEGSVRAALDVLRDASSAWRDLDVPYEGARTRVLLGVAQRRLGDDDTAAMEWHAARQTFQTLAATTDLHRLDLIVGGKPPPGHGLTAREIEVLGLITSGMTNKSIAERLVLSERTVDRHVSNVFTKIGVSSRAAATAYAYEHNLV